MKKFLPVFLILIFLTSCKAAKTSDSFSAMNTFMTVSVYAPAKKGKVLCKKIHSRIDELEAVLSTTLLESDVHKLNNKKQLDFPVNKDLLTLLDFSREINKQTFGAFNPALYPVIREWGFTTGNYKIPDSSRLETLLANTDFSKIIFDENKVLLEFGMELDFGAVGKGYACDQAIEILKSNGVQSALLYFGGNIQTLGTKPDGSLWRVGIKNPWNNDSAVSLKVESKAVVTSGGYERFFELDGKRYIHIFDPKTGRPSQNDLESVTIVCESGTYADALSTALFVMGKEKAVEWWKTHQNFDFVLLTKERALVYSCGLEKIIEPLIDFSYIERIDF